MSVEQFHQAREALRTAVEEHDRAVLSNAATLASLLKDLLADAPRVAKILIAASEDGVANMLDEYARQGLDGATAARLVASSFAAGTMFTPDACAWATTEFAVALGIISAGGPVTIMAHEPGEPASTSASGEPVPAAILPLDPAHHILGGHANKIYGVAFSPDGKQLASAGTDGTVWLWNPATGENVHQLAGHGDAVYSLAFGPRRNHLASGGADGWVRVWDPIGSETKPTPTVLNRHSGAVYTVAFSPDGTQLASGGVDGRVLLAPVVTPSAPLPRLRYPSGAVRAESIDGGRQHVGAVRGVAFSPDAELLASGGDDGSVRVWDLARLYAEGGELTSFSHPGAVHSVAFSPDGRWLASGAADGTVLLWHAATIGLAVVEPTARGRTPSSAVQHLRTVQRHGTGARDPVAPNRKLAAHAGEVYGLAFSRDGRSLASGGTDGMVRLWDPATGKNRRTLTGHAAAVWSVAFSPDERLLASVSSDQTVRLWDLSE